MLVKCQDTGEKIEKTIAYREERVSSGGKITARYWSSKEAFEKWKQQSENRKLVVDYMYKLLDYETWMKIPTIFYKKLEGWEPYGFDVVLRSMEDNTDSIIWALKNKEFRQESAKVMYICAIIENHINDALKNIVRERKIKTQQKNEEVEMYDVVNSKQKTKDISRFLED